MVKISDQPLCEELEPLDNSINHVDCNGGALLLIILLEHVYWLEILKYREGYMKAYLANQNIQIMGIQSRV